MRKFLAFIALFVALGFAGGAEAHSVVRSSAQRVEAAAVSVGQFISADSEHTAHQTNQEESNCCWDGLCFNSSHCHHCGGATALLIPAPSSIMMSVSHGKLGSLTDTMPVLSVSYTIIDPPRA
jgi:hypothetical protein